MQPKTNPATKADLDAFEQRLTDKLSELLEELRCAQRLLPEARSELTLEDLVARITPENRHGEEVGRQVHDRLERMQELAKDANPAGYTKADTRRLIEESRRETKAARKK